MKAGISDHVWNRRKCGTAMGELLLVTLAPQPVEQQGPDFPVLPRKKEYLFSGPGRGDP